MSLTMGSIWPFSPFCICQMLCSQCSLLQKRLHADKSAIFDALMWHCMAMAIVDPLWLWQLLILYYHAQCLSNVWVLPDDLSHLSTLLLGTKALSSEAWYPRQDQANLTQVLCLLMRWEYEWSIFELNTDQSLSSRNNCPLIVMTSCRHMDTVVGMVHPCWVNSQGNSQAYRGIIPPGCVWGTPLNPPPGWQMNNTNDSGPLLGSAASHHASLLRHNSAPGKHLWHKFNLLWTFMPNFCVPGCPSYPNCVITFIMWEPNMYEARAVKVRIGQSNNG